MTTKRALIVDDSKSARVVLSRLLERHALTVDTTESAESALVYLQENKPDVIFMDHVMSGMDGLQAVQAIKRDPRTAEIPIMMYTSQDGEVYAGEARASGAAGVVPKLMAPTDIAKMLYALELLPAPAASPVPGFGQIELAASGVAVEANAAAAAEVAGPTADVPAPAAPPPPALVAADIHAIVEPLIKDHVSDLRRFFVASLESTSTRLATDLGAQLQNVLAAVTPLPSEPVAEIPLPPPPRPVAWMALALLGCLAALGTAYVAWQQHQELTVLGARLDRQASALAATQREFEAARGSVPAAAIAAGPAPERLLVPYGEATFAAARLTTLSARVAELTKAGFVGTVRVTVGAGDFCLTGNPAEGYGLAPAEMPANRCDVVGNPYEESLRPTEREPAALAALITATRERSHDAVELSIVRADRGMASDYPHEPEATAAQWNAVAATHSYLEIVPVPRASTP